MDANLDHVVVVVPDLPETVERFVDAGFRVAPGGRHDVLPTENALVPFADGGYLELLAARERTLRDQLRSLAGTPRWRAHLEGVSAIARRFLPRLAGPDGVGDYVVVRDHLARFAREARRKGFVMTGPVPMSREAAGGGRLAWELLLPEDDAVPFVIEDRTPRERRVPRSPEATTHPNGARGIDTVRVRCADVPAAAFALSDLFALTPRMRSDGTTALALGGATVVLVPGSPPGACAVEIAGVAVLPAPLEVLGVCGADAP